MIIVAEIKPSSPFGFTNTLSPKDQLRRCESVGDIIGVHTNELWGGSWGWFEEVRKLTWKPILAKGFHDTIEDVRRAVGCGATYVLTVGWWPSDVRCWHECESLDELRATDATRAVWNARDPRTGLARKETIAEARSAREGWLCQASRIGSPGDVGGVQAVILGEALYRPGWESLVADIRKNCIMRKLRR